MFFKMCINTTKSRKKRHNVVDFLEDVDMPLMPPAKVEGTPFYAGQVLGEKHALIWMIRG
jgi:hypothetical protein